jgi:hypothetical protein
VVPLLEAIHSDLQELCCRLSGREAQPAVHPPALSPAAPGASALPEQLVTLDQIGAMVHRCKRSMERYRGRLPAPRVRGRRGSPHLWSWPEVRPWLEEAFSVRLPERFPGLSR